MYPRIHRRTPLRSSIANQGITSMNCRNSNLSGVIFDEASVIASSPQIGDYEIWRLLRNVENEYYKYNRMEGALPFELARLRLVLSNAHRLRARSSSGVADFR